MKRIFAVFKKEIIRFFTDKRMLMALIFPGIIIFLVYTLAGNFFNPETIGSVDKDYQFNIALTNNYNDEDYIDGKPINGAQLCGGIKALYKGLEYNKEPNFIYIDKSEENEYKEKLKTKEIDALVLYDTNNFDRLIFQGTTDSSKLNVRIFYNSENKASELSYNVASQAMNLIYTGFAINLGVDNPNVGQNSEMMSQIIAMILPMISLSILYSVAVTVVPESIAGEKERGTLSAVLITPIKRSEFAIGKILALSVVTLFGGIISVGGMLLSLPTLMHTQGTMTISGSSYALIFFILILLMFFFVNVATTISTWAKSIREASGYLGPMTAVILIGGILPGVMDCSNIGLAFVPILNATQSLYSVITGTTDITFLITTLAMTLLYSIILIMIDVKMFKTESIVMRQ